MPTITLNAYDMLTGGHEGDAVGGAQLQQNDFNEPHYIISCEIDHAQRVTTERFKTYRPSVPQSVPTYLYI